MAFILGIYLFLCQDLSNHAKQLDLDHLPTLNIGYTFLTVGHVAFIPMIPSI